MTGQPNYSTEELAKIAGAMMISGIAVSMVDLGIVSTAIEANALAKELAGAAKKYPYNSIIQAIFAEEAIKTQIEVKFENMKPDTVIATAVTVINEGISVLEGKATPEEIKEYKEFIYASAEQVAKAAGSGLFGTGEKVSPKEAAALAKIKEILAV